ncbi:MAG: nitroreductase family protein, partial [Candidatus Caldatribacteriota bacterium]|nr:nitroreductase family protein [Candidatus Caldatribacteriota bacterium]
MTKAEFSSFTGYHVYSPEEMKKRSAEFYAEMKRRRSVRQFSDRPVPREIIEDCLRTAVTAPSGANMQPWSFAVVSDPAVKRQIRKEAEKTEGEFYHKSTNQKWLDDLKVLDTSENKSFLEVAPYLIVIFSQRYALLPDGSKKNHYYVTESVGIATGMLIAAVHHAGLVCLTYTPSKKGFLNQILSRSSNEKPLLILVVGYPAKDAVLPKIAKKSLKDVA